MMRGLVLVVYFVENHSNSIQKMTHCMIFGALFYIIDIYFFSEEHRSHSPTCVFLPLMDKPEEEWTGRDMKVLLAALLTESSVSFFKSCLDIINITLAIVDDAVKELES